jgi:hypothetical protein
MIRNNNQGSKKENVMSNPKLYGLIYMDIIIQQFREIAHAVLMSFGDISSIIRREPGAIH